MSGAVTPVGYNIAMSYPYRVVVRGAIRETIRSEQESRRRLETPSMVPELRGKGLLAEALERRGFGRRADGRLERRKDGLLEVFDPVTLEVTTRIAEERTVVEEAQEVVTSERAKLGARKRNALERGIEDGLRRRENEKLQAELARRLAQTDESRRRELEEASAEATGKALEEKASEIGEVTSVQGGWTGDEFNLVIRVRE